MCGGRQASAQHNYVLDRGKPDGERKYESRNDVDGIDLDKLAISKTPWDVNSVLADGALSEGTSGVARAQGEKTASRLGNSPRNSKVKDRNLFASSGANNDTKKILLGG